MLDNLIGPNSTDRKIFFYVGEEDCYFHSDSRPHFIPNKKVLTNNGQYMSVVNRQYRVVQNSEVLIPLQEQIVEFFDPMVASKVQIKDTIIKGGNVCWAEYTLPTFNDIGGGISTKTGHTTSFKLRFILKNTFDGHGSVLLYSGDIDSFCTNGMISGSYDITRRRHTKNFSVEGFHTAFKSSILKYHQQVIKYQQWADTMVSTVKVKQLLDKLTKTTEERKRKNILSDRLLAQFTQEADVRGGNVFALSSALTAYASHNSQRFPLNKRGGELSLLKRQEKVGKWLSSDIFKDFMETVRP